MPDEFRHELTNLINRYGLENLSNTQDFILADYLIRCLEAHTAATNHRERLRSNAPD